MQRKRTKEQYKYELLFTHDVLKQTQTSEGWLHRKWRPVDLISNIRSNNVHYETDLSRSPLQNVNAELLLQNHSYHHTLFVIIIFLIMLFQINIGTDLTRVKDMILIFEYNNILIILPNYFTLSKESSFKRNYYTFKNIKGPKS